MAYGDEKFRPSEIINKALELGICTTDNEFVIAIKKKKEDISDLPIAQLRNSDASKPINLCDTTAKAKAPHAIAKSENSKDKFIALLLLEQYGSTDEIKRKGTSALGKSYEALSKKKLTSPISDSTITTLIKSAIKNLEDNAKT